jgi:hypothetical protein
MSANPRLLLKHSTGWFAAGCEVAEALALLPDAAFRKRLGNPSSGSVLRK